MNQHRLFYCILLISSASQLAAEAEETKGPVKVFILAGQSNMEGAGRVDSKGARNDGKGTLENLVKNEQTAARFKQTVDGTGHWTVRKDVGIWYLGRSGSLTVEYGARKDRSGPEFQFGHVVGDHFQQPVVLIKTACGGKNLIKDFRPPSSGGEVGPYYTKMIGHIKEVLSNLEKHFPALEGRGYEIAGFAWHQGWNDGLTAKAVTDYEKNVANFMNFFIPSSVMVRALTDLP
jgi:alpha-galactosidase